MFRLGLWATGIVTTLGLIQSILPSTTLAQSQPLTNADKSRAGFNHPFPQPNYDIELQIEAIAKLAGLPSDSTLLNNVRKMIRGDQTDNHQSESLPKSNKTILAHIKGTKGIPFPKTATNENTFVSPSIDEFKLTNVLSSYDSEKNEWEGKGEEAEEEQVDDSLIPRPLPNCSKNFTQKVPIELVGFIDPSDIGTDILFLRNTPHNQSLTNSDHSRLFGQNTVVYLYTQEELDPLSLELSEYDNACLPIRSRVTQKAIYFHYGNHALKNFDDKNGKGFLHKEVKRNISNYY